MPAKQTVDLGARHTHLLRKRTLRRAGTAQMGLHRARDLLLNPRRATHRIRIVRASPFDWTWKTESRKMLHGVGRRHSFRSHSFCPHLCAPVIQTQLRVWQTRHWLVDAHVLVMTPINTLLTTYTANLPEDVWDKIGPFVRRTVADRYADGRKLETVRFGLIIFAGYVDWVVFHGLGQPDDTILNAELIDAFTVARRDEVKVAVADRERKLIRTIAGLANNADDRFSSTDADPSVPYTVEEEGAIRRWAEGQPSETRRRQCGAAAALALGCGLTPAEVRHVRVSDLHRLADGMVAVTLTDGRVVPVRAWWNDLLVAAMEGEPDEYVICPTAVKRTPYRLVQFLRNSRGISPSLQRMRATWLLRHVDAGTPLNNLLAAAGLGSSDVLRRVLPFAIRLDGAAAVDALRLGAEVAR